MGSCEVSGWRFGIAFTVTRPANSGKVSRTRPTKTRDGPRCPRSLKRKCKLSLSCGFHISVPEREDFPSSQERENYSFAWSGFDNVIQAYSQLFNRVTKVIKSISTRPSEGGICDNIL